MSTPRSTEVRFEAIGTRWNIQLFDVVDVQLLAELKKTVMEQIDTFDRNYSRFRTDSLVTQMSRIAGTYQLPPDAYELLNTYHLLYRASGGQVTPLIGNVMSDAGYDANYSLKPQKLRQPPSWDEALDFNQDQLTIHKPVLLDFGAAGKGYLVDIVAKIIDSFGVDAYLINAGGDILHRSKDDRSAIVALENPMDTTEAIGMARITNQSLCASAGSKRAWGEFTHIIDPLTLKSPLDIIATWVIAGNTITADGIATALFFQSPQKLKKEFTFEYALLTKDMALSYSAGFPVEPFTEESQV